MCSEKELVCVQCAQNFKDPHDESTKSTCIECLERALDFLSFEFDCKSASGISRPDLVIFVDGKKIKAHKLILASKSTVFRKMFDTDMLEKKTGTLMIKDATFPVMQAVVQFCYSAEIQFTEEVTAAEVFEVAHKYAIDILVGICDITLKETITETNLTKMLRLAKKYAAVDLQKAAEDYFKENFDLAIGMVVEELYSPPSYLPVTGK